MRVRDPLGFCRSLTPDNRNHSIRGFKIQTLGSMLKGLKGFLRGIKLSVSNIANVWRQKAYRSIPLSGLNLLPDTPTQMQLQERIRWVSDVQIAGEVKDVLLTFPVSSVCYRLYIPPRAKFLSHIALTPESWEKNHHGIVFQVEVLDRCGRTKIKRAKLICPKLIDRHRKWVKLKVGLRGLANLEAQIVLSTSLPHGGDPIHTSAIWGNPAIWFRLSVANIIDLARNKLVAHGFFGSIRKFIDNSHAQTMALQLRSPLQKPSSETISENTSISRYLKEVFARSRGSGPEYVSIRNDDVNATESSVKLIAFYLPQFHPIPENDKWWGKGFTEWTHVTRATSQFVGHYQPRLPGELGFYDLRLPDVQRRQVELAKKYGIFGFCFHYYWFAGRRLLDLPLKQFLDSPGLDFPFCLCWANENWTRRWDGLDQEVLITQAHSPEDDLAFIRSIELMFHDRRYIKVNGRPLLVVYRPSLFPNPRDTAQRWREYCAKSALGDLYLVAVQAFGTVDPRPLGFDAAVEFPPHKLAEGGPLLNGQMEIINPDYEGVISDYSFMIESARKVCRPEFTLFRGVCPSWDNDARKPGRGITYQNSSPLLYEQWLTEACRYASQEPDPDKRLVFINAWNEWSEGAYLEPDRRYGYAYLEATASAVKRFTNSKGQNGLEVVFVSHDAANAGAQRLLLTLIEWLRDEKNVQPKIILRRGGPLISEFYRLGPVLELDAIFASDLKRTSKQIIRFCGNSSSLVYINTLVPGDIAKVLSDLKIPILTHAHELETAIRRWCTRDDLEQLIELTDHFIAASPPVARNLENVHHTKPERITTIYEFIKCKKESVDPTNRATTRRQKQLPDKGFIVFGCGTTDWRKGPDLFIEVAHQATRLGIKDAYFFWIGVDTGEGEKLEMNLRELNLLDRVRFLGEVQDVRSYFAEGDVFLLTSREDPFPLVSLEAADCGLPIICFDKAGGTPDFVQQDAGYVVPFEDTRTMAEKLMILSVNGEERIQRGSIARQRVRRCHDVSVAGEEIFRIIEKFAAGRDRVNN